MNEHTRDDLVHRLLDEVSALKEEVARLNGRREAEPAPDGPISRRRLLGKAAAAAAGGAGLLIAGAAPAAAGVDGDVVLGGYNDAGSSPTTLTSTAAFPAETLAVYNSSGGAGIYAANVGWGQAISAYSGSGSAVAAQSGSGDAVTATISAANVYSAVNAHSTSTSGHAVLAQVDEGTNTNAAVQAVHSGPGPGIYASSAKGRGGQFAGKKAQVRLTPAGAATHPASGQAGDLYVDSAKRLWFCKGGTTWVQLA